MVESKFQGTLYIDPTVKSPPLYDPRTGQAPPEITTPGSYAYQAMQLKRGFDHMTVENFLKSPIYEHTHKPFYGGATYFPIKWFL